MSIGAQFAGALIILAASLGGATAQDNYPKRPITVISPDRGGVGEISARLIGEPMKTLGQPLVIDSRAGGASKIGTEAVVRAPKDGYTLLFQNVVYLILPTVAAPLTYDPTRICADHPDDQLSADAGYRFATRLPVADHLSQEQPGKASYSSGGPGSAMQFAGEMLKIMAGVDMLHVPYRGMSAAVNDTIAGHVQLSFDFSPRRRSTPANSRRSRPRAYVVPTCVSRMFRR